jgi:hypothetical protein
MPLRPWQAFCAASRVPPAAADPAGAFVFWDWRFRLSRGIFPAMKLDRLLEMPGTERILPAPADVEVSAAFTSDLLSDVLAHAVENSILITIQAHQNAIAVATLAGIRAILACSRVRSRPTCGLRPQEASAFIARRSTNSTPPWPSTSVGFRPMSYRA